MKAVLLPHPQEKLPKANACLMSVFDMVTNLKVLPTHLNREFKRNKKKYISEPSSSVKHLKWWSEN